MPIVSICPKCGKKGSQHINYKPLKSDPRRGYLSFIHSKEKRCFIGRVRTTDEALSEFNKPETVEEYKEALENITRELRSLINRYSAMNQGSVQSISKRLKTILGRYGY